MSDAPPVRPWYSFQVTLPLLIGLVVTSASLIAWAVTSANRAQDALTEVADVRTQLEAVRAAVGAIPSLQIHTENIEKWIAHTEAVLDARDQRIAAVERGIVVLQVQLGAANTTAPPHAAPQR